MRAGLLELLRVHLAHLAHRVRRRASTLPVANDLLDVRQAEAHVLELAYPADTDEGVLPVEPEAPLGAGRRLEEPELLVQVNRADGLPGIAREVADLTELSVGGFALAVLRFGHEHELTGGLRRGGGEEGVGRRCPTWRVLPRTLT